LADQDSVKSLARLHFILHGFFKSTLAEDFKSRDSHQRFGVLSLLAVRGDQGLGELAEELGVSSSSLCIMMNRLEEGGTIRRHADPKDRRRVYYALTAGGKEHLEKERGIRLSALAEGLSRWPEDKQAEILELSRRLADLMNTPEVCGKIPL
jgi:DNA-binding MarR family transcriptional regulator